jgi:hypothetical protein
MSGFKDGGQVIVPVPLEFTGVLIPLSCIITVGPAPILRSVNKVSAKTWRILSENDAISMTTGP